MLRQLRYAASASGSTAGRFHRSSSIVPCGSMIFAINNNVLLQSVTEVSLYALAMVCLHRMLSLHLLPGFALDTHARVRGQRSTHRPRFGVLVKCQTSLVLFDPRRYTSCLNCTQLSRILANESKSHSTPRSQNPEDRAT